MRVTNVIRSAWAGWNRNRGSDMSASLAFFSLLSLVPLLTFSLTLAGWFLGNTSAERILTRQVGRDFGESVSQALRGTMTSGRTESGSALSAVTGVVLMLAGAAGVAGELRCSLNLIWGAPAARGGWLGMLQMRLRELALVLMLLLAVLAASAAGAATALAGETLAWLLHTSQKGLILGNAVFSLTVLMFLFLLVHKYVPDVDVSWRGAVAAAVCTVTLFTAGKELVVLYLQKSTVSSAFGPGQSVVALLLWAYFSSCVVFLGAEFGAAWVAERGSGGKPENPTLQPADCRGRSMSKTVDRTIGENCVRRTTGFKSGDPESRPGRLH